MKAKVRKKALRKKAGRKKGKQPVIALPGISDKGRDYFMAKLEEKLEKGR